MAPLLQKMLSHDVNIDNGTGKEKDKEMKQNEQEAELISMNINTHDDLQIEPTLNSDLQIEPTLNSCLEDKNLKLPVGQRDLKKKS